MGSSKVEADDVGDMKCIITDSHTFAHTHDLIKQLEGHDLYKPCFFVCLIDFISAFKSIQIQSQSTKFRTITNTMNTIFTKVIK